MPNFEDLGLQASLKGHETGDLNGEGPKLPNVKKLLPEMRKEGLLGEQANRLEMRSQGSVSGGVGREATKEDIGSHNGPNPPRVEPEERQDQHKRAKQGSPKEYPGDMVAHMHLDKPNFSQPGKTRKRIAWGENCNRASGLSGRVQVQQSMESESENVAKMVSSSKPGQKVDKGVPKNANDGKVSKPTATVLKTKSAPLFDAKYQQREDSHDENTSTSKRLNSEKACFICSEDYSWEDEKIFTECCNMAMGSRCKAQYIADTGECWNCGMKEVQNEQVHEVEPWVPYDPKDFVNRTKSLSRYAALFPANGAGRQSTKAIMKGDSVLPSGSKLGCFNISSSSHTRASGESAIVQPLSMNKKQCAEEARSSASQPPPNPIDGGNMKNNARYDAANGGFVQAKVTPPESPIFLYNGSESATSESSRDYQEEFRGLTEEDQKRQDAKQYVMEATKHMVEMCNAYGDDIDETDMDEVMDMFLKAVGGCKAFQASIEKRTLGTPSAPTSVPASAQSPASVGTSDVKRDEGQTYCIKCEDLEMRFKKVVDTLRGL